MNAFLRRLDEALVVALRLHSETGEIIADELERVIAVERARDELAQVAAQVRQDILEGELSA